MKATYVIIINFLCDFMYISVRTFNPLSPKCDQYQISPCNINAYSTPAVMRTKDNITQGEFS